MRHSSGGAQWVADKAQRSQRRHRANPELGAPRAPQPQQPSVTSSDVTGVRHTERGKGGRNVSGLLQCLEMGKTVTTLLSSSNGFWKCQHQSHRSLFAPSTHSFRFKITLFWCFAAIALLPSCPCTKSNTTQVSSNNMQGNPRTSYFRSTNPCLGHDTVDGRHVDACRAT